MQGHTIVKVEKGRYKRVKHASLSVCTSKEQEYKMAAVASIVLLAIEFPYSPRNYLQIVKPLLHRPVTAVSLLVY